MHQPDYGRALALRVLPSSCQSVKRISFSLQTSNASASLLLPPSKVAATETVQPFAFGSLTAVRPLGASGFESVVV